MDVFTTAFALPLICHKTFHMSDHRFVCSGPIFSNRFLSRDHSARFADAVTSKLGNFRRI
jgi:hypothetical protein